MISAMSITSRIPDMPHMLSLPAGQGNAFKKEMETLIESLKKKIPLIFENETYLNKKKEVVEKFRNKQAEMFREFEKKVNKEGFCPGSDPDGALLPSWDLSPWSKGILSTLTNWRPWWRRESSPKKIWKSIKEKAGRTGQ